jgi:hypothetical protein
MSTLRHLGPREHQYQNAVRSFEAAREEASDLLADALRERLERLFERSPQLRVTFLDAMGSATILVTGRGRRPATCWETFFDRNFPHAADTQALLKWYNTEADKYRVYAAGFTIEPRK